MQKFIKTSSVPNKFVIIKHDMVLEAADTQSLAMNILASTQIKRA